MLWNDFTWNHKQIFRSKCRERNVRNSFDNTFGMSRISENWRMSESSQRILTKSSENEKLIRLNIFFSFKNKCKGPHGFINKYQIFKESRKDLKESVGIVWIYHLDSASKHQFSESQENLLEHSRIFIILIKFPNSLRNIHFNLSRLP